MNLSSLLASPVFIVLFKWTWLLALGWAVHSILHRRHARWRLILWRSILCFGLVLPLLQFLEVPGIRIPIPGDNASRTEFASPPFSVPAVKPAQPAPGLASMSADSLRPQTRSKPIPWVLIITVVWILGCACGFVRLIRLNLQLSRLRKESCNPASDLRGLATQIQIRLNVHREVDVQISDSVTSPFVCGLLRPAIILPRLLAQQLSPAEVSALLSHEIAHVREHDLVWCVAWRWMKALCWFHPLVWNVPAAHNLACDQEADRIASGQLADQDSYARMLARLALRVLALPTVETTLALNGSSQIARRLNLLGKKGIGAWDWRYSLAAFGLAGSLFLMTAGCGFSESQNITWTGGPSTVEQASPVPANAYTYPASYGVYLLNGSVFSRIISKLVPTNPSGDLSLLVFEKWVADPKADISAIVIDDLRHVGETPMPHVSVVTRRVENHPDMVMVVPNQPLDAGLYSVSVKAGVDVPEYGFGVETPDPVAFWKSVVQDHPTIWQAHNHLGATLYMDGDVKDAYPQFLKATQLNPQNPESHNNLGLALGYLGKTDEAIKQFELAVKIKDDPAIETNLANAYEQVKRYDDAIRTYRHAIQLNPNNTTAHCNLGFVLMQEGKVDDAIREFEKTLKLDPNMPPAQTGLQQALGLKANKQ